MPKKSIGYIISIFISLVLFIKPRIIYIMSNGLNIDIIHDRVIFLIVTLFLFSKGVEKFFE